MFSKASDFLRRYFKTTGFRLAAWYAGFFLAGSLCVLGLAYFLIASSLKKDSSAKIQAEFTELSREYAANGLKNFRVETRPDGLPGEIPFFVRVLAADGAEVFVSGEDRYVAFSGAVKKIPAVGAQERWAFAGIPGEEDELELLSGRLPGGAVLQVGLTTAGREQALEKFQDIALMVMIPALLLAVLGGAFLTNRALEPLRHLVATVREIEAGSLGARVPVRGTGDELDAAGELFNGMLARISSLVSGMREALDNVAHDLRTPMARLRATAESALNGKPSAENRGEALSDCLEETERVLILLDAIMEVSEAEAGVIKLKREAARLADLAAEVAEVYNYAAEAKGVTVSVRVESDLTVACDRARLRQALGNLVDNAVKYSPAGTGVDISLSSEKGSAVFSVADRGPGIPAADLPHIWERLYRGDASRHEKGLGLGLSLVRAVALAHGGVAAVRERPGGGSVFTLSIPAA